MKSNKRIILLLLFSLFIIITGCQNVPNSEIELDKKRQEIYNLAVESGYPRSYKEWQETIKGIDGISIVGVEITEEGELIVTLLNGEETNLGNINHQPITKEEIIPVYQGMTIESIDLNESKKKAKKDQNTLKYQDTIDDYLDIETTEKVEYYATKGEIFNLIVHIYNPQAYEILSFTLNGYKYQSYEFKEGSNSTKLIIEVNAGLVSGIKEYTIEGIKYIKGTEIKDVRMEGEKTIKTGVKYDIVPTATILNEEIGTLFYQAVIEIKDDLKLMDETTGMHFFAFDGSSIVAHETLKPGINTIEMNNLWMGKEYAIIIVGVYDDYSGKGKQANNLIEKTIETIDGYLFNEVTSTKDSISISIDQYDELATIQKIGLYQNNQLIESKELSERITFNGLLSNNEYLVKVTYSYVQSDIEREKTISYTIKTKAKQEPVVSFNSLSANQTEIEYQLMESDVDNIKDSLLIELYLDNVKISESTKNNYLFTNLYSGREYQLVITYEYDLNDGTGTKKVKKVESIVTKSYSAPTIDLSYSAVENEISYTLYIVDLDQTLKNFMCKLYLGNNLINMSTSYEGLFNNLLSNTSYDFVVNYSFDLNDGNSEITKNITYHITTLKQTPTISLTPYFISQNNIEYNLLIADPNASGHVQMIALYQGTTFIKRLSESTTLIDSLNSNTEYKIKVNYVYDFDDGMGSREINYQYSFTTLKAEPTIEIIATNITKNSIEIDYNLRDEDSALTIKKLELFYNNQLIKEYTSWNNKLFDELLSNSNYQIVGTFIKNVNLGEETITRTVNIKTESMNTPSVDINLASTKTSISYDYQISDPDNISTISTIDLYYQGNKLDLNSSNKEFTGLYSNSLYEIVITLLCDYHDGEAPKEEKYSKRITTDRYNEPTVSLDLTSTEETINFEFNDNDPDNLIISKKINVYSGSRFIKEITNLNEKIINELSSNTLYRLEVVYKYDLNDNKGVITKTYERTYSTLAYNVKILNYSVMNEYAPKTNEDINILIKIENRSNIKVEYLIVNGEKKDILGGDSYNNLIIVERSPKVSGPYSVVIDKMGYLINGMEIEQKVESTIEIKIEILSRLDIIDVNLLDGSNFLKNEYGMGVVFTIDNPHDYQIIEYDLLLGSEENTFPAIMIDSNHVYIDTVLYSRFSNFNTITVQAVRYYDSEKNLTERNYNDNIILDLINIESEADTNALVVHQISTPEEFIMMENGKIYEIICDLDLSGYKWTPRDFNGYIDGKGHRISNISIIIENEYSTQSVGIFNELQGTIKNIYFENIYMNVETGNSVNSQVLCVNNSATIENILISGNLIFKPANNSTYRLPNGKNIYVVDHLNYNGTTYSGKNLISYETYNSRDFRENTLNWLFIKKHHENYNGLKYTIIANSYIIITGYTGSDDEVIIPETINGLPVLGISDLAFEDYTTIKSIEYPESLLMVGAATLKGCYNIETIIIDEATSFLGVNILHTLFGGVPYDQSYSVVRVDEFLPYQITTYVPNKFKNLVFKSKYQIGDKWNQNYRLMEISFRYATSLEKVVIDCPGNLQYYMFSGCSSLKEVVLNNITEIPYSSFAACTNLKSITISDSITKIGGDAFEACSSLASITIPDSVTSIGSGAFRYCSSLTNISIGKNVTSIGDYAFNICRSLTSITIPDSVSILRESTFYDCSNLTNITIPNSVSIIEGSVFYNCKSLTNITIPDSVTYIGSNAFNGCSSLKTIKIPSGITIINDYALSSCNSLTSVEIPNSVTKIGYGAFFGSHVLSSVYYKGTSTEWSLITVQIYNSSLLAATIYYYSEEEPTNEGNYWHYEYGVIKKW